MKKLRALLSVLALLVGTSSCFASQANSHYPKLVCDHGNMHYTINYGDTLSGIAQHYRQSMTVIANVRANGIVEVNRIYAGNDLVIPCAAETATTSSTTTVRKMQDAVSRSTVHEEPIAFEANSDNFLIASEPVETLSLAVSSFVEPPVPATTVADAVVPTQQEPTPLPSRLRSRKIKTKKVKGYKLVLTAAEAKTDGLTLNRDLDTRMIMFKTEQDKLHGIRSGERHHLRARARQEGNNVVLYIRLTEKPQQPFIMLILGTTQPIDGDYLLANAIPFSGRFPGPNGFERCLFGSGRMLLTAGIVTFASGGNFPLGIAVGFGAPAVHHLLQHKINMMQENAEDTLLLANIQFQPTEIAVTNPQN